MPYGDTSFRDNSLTQFFNPRRIPRYIYPLVTVVVSANVGAAWFLLYTAGKPEVEWHRDKIKHSQYSNTDIEQDQTTKLYNPWSGKRFKERLNQFT